MQRRSLSAHSISFRAPTAPLSPCPRRRQKVIWDIVPISRRPRRRQHPTPLISIFITTSIVVINPVIVHFPSRRWRRRRASAPSAKDLISFRIRSTSRQRHARNTIRSGQIAPLLLILPPLLSTPTRIPTLLTPRRLLMMVASSTTSTSTNTTVLRRETLLLRLLPLPQALLVSPPSVPCHFIALRDPLPADLPIPAIAARVAHGHRPQPGVVAK